MTRMRVLTWNIHGLRDASLATIAAEIAAQAPDVVCLNEVPRRLGARLGAALGMRAFVASSPIGPYGNAVLTREPIAVTLPLRFHGVRRVARRDAAVIGFHSELIIAAVHLSLRAPERLRHIEQLLDALPDRAIVAGDMNEQPGGNVWRALDARLDDAGTTVGEPTFPASGPTARIDAIWTPRGARVTRYDVLLTTSSDHRPIIAELDLPG